MLNVHQDGDYITAYIVTFQFTNQLFVLSRSGNSGATVDGMIESNSAPKYATGGVYWIKYKIGNNTNLLEEVRYIDSFDAQGDSSRTSGNFKGKITIMYTNEGYRIIADGGRFDCKIKLTEEAKKYKNNFGFYSQHYSHGCRYCGFFKLSRIKVEGRAKAIGE